MRPFQGTQAWEERKVEGGTDGEGHILPLRIPILREVDRGRIHPDRSRLAPGALRESRIRGRMYR